MCHTRGIILTTTTNGSEVQVCKHDIDWDEPEIIDINPDEVRLQVQCKKCDEYWDLVYECSSLAKADSEGLLFSVDDFEQNVDGSYPEE